ncbi:aa3-type cytochrome c oxidase subunit IV [Aureimonas flava]|uniref:Aa3-type cytochrome c oxidase subunit IV n=1 Tax=Aureimonas flava TaxID=2320271 RepID=A0A3A1WP97_9HYPH|nr:aa3-type cytochrome c oxidase subunit IV [Aureimonas flava]RIY01956.1 aa3-type cytochrome c oxidase subunit IV [Aureimonas flava]
MAEEQGYEWKGTTMDYAEHDRTYMGFLWLVKYGSIAVVAILLGMLAGLVASAGIILSVLAAVVFFVVASYVLGGDAQVKTDRPDLEPHH